MTRLLIFHSALAPYRVDFFNLLAESFETELVLFDRNLVNQKFDQTALVGRLKCKVSYLDSGFRYKDRYFRLGALRKLWMAHPDVVLLPEYGVVSIAVVFWKSLTHAKFKVYTMTDDNLMMFHRHRMRGLRGVIFRWFARTLDGFVVTSDAVKQEILRSVPLRREVKICVVPILHGEIENRAEIFSKGKVWRMTHAPDAKAVLLFVGRLAPEKNVDWLIERMGKLPSSYRLVIVGSGPDEDMLKAKACALPQVAFVGRKEGDEVYAMMSMADALVLPSLFEPYGAVVGEALQIGTPCLVSQNVGACVLIREGINGACFDLRREKEFTDQLERVLAIKKTGMSLLETDLRSGVAELVRVIKGDICGKGCSDA